MLTQMRPWSSRLRAHLFWAVYNQRAHTIGYSNGAITVTTTRQQTVSLCAYGKKEFSMNASTIKELLIALAAELDAPEGQGSGAVLLEAHTLIEEYERIHPPQCDDG